MMTEQEWLTALATAPDAIARNEAAIALADLESTFRLILNERLDLILDDAVEATEEAFLSLQDRLAASDWFPKHTLHRLAGK